MLTSVTMNVEEARSQKTGFTINHDLDPLGKYPYPGPFRHSPSHYPRKVEILPQAAASSAYQICEHNFSSR